MAHLPFPACLLCWMTPFPCFMFYRRHAYHNVSNRTRIVKTPGMLKGAARDCTDLHACELCLVRMLSSNLFPLLQVAAWCTST